VKLTWHRLSLRVICDCPRCLWLSFSGVTLTNKVSNQAKRGGSLEKFLACGVIGMNEGAIVSIVVAA